MKKPKRKREFYYSWDGIDGSLEFFAGIPHHGNIYGKRYGPFSTFAQARQDLIARIKSDISELKLSLWEARNAKAPEVD